MSSSPPNIQIYPTPQLLITTLAPTDVLSGHSTLARTHAGTIHLKNVLVQEYKEEYNHVSTKKKDKLHVAARLVADVRRRGGRFLKERSGVSGGGYCEIGDEKAWKSKF